MTSPRARRPPSVTFTLPLGEVILQIPETRRVVQAPGLDVGHVVIEYRTRGELIALAAYRLPAKLAASLAVIAIVALVVLVHAAPSDPYYAQSLQDWEQGRFVRFHGITQWLGWLWPYAALAWLLSRLAEGRSASAGFP